VNPIENDFSHHTKRVRLISKGFHLDLTKKVIPYKEMNLKKEVFKPFNGRILLLAA